jgi:hypothetical protein
VGLEVRVGLLTGVEVRVVVKESVGVPVKVLVGVAVGVGVELAVKVRVALGVEVGTGVPPPAEATKLQTLCAGRV